MGNKCPRNSAFGGDDESLVKLVSLVVVDQCQLSEYMKTHSIVFR